MNPQKPGEKLEPTLTTFTTFKGNIGAGSFGYLLAPPPPPLPDIIDPSLIGMSFGTVTTVPEIKQAQVIPLIVEDEETWVVAGDNRSQPDLRKQAMALIDNMLDLPPDIINKAKLLTQQQTIELRDYVMINVVPLMLSIEPALTSVKQMVPCIFDNNTADGLEIDISIESLSSYGYTLGILASRIKLMNMLDLTDAVKSRLINRLVPEESRGNK